VGSESFPESPSHSFVGVVLENEPCPGSFGDIGRFHGVGETSGSSDNGESPVGEGIHLVEAARLIQRRHQEYVRTCLDLVREGVVVAFCETQFGWETGLEAREHFHVFRFA